MDVDDDDCDWLDVLQPPAPPPPALPPPALLMPPGAPPIPVVPAPVPVPAHAGDPPRQYGWTSLQLSHPSHRNQLEEHLATALMRGIRAAKSFDKLQTSDRAALVKAVDGVSRSLSRGDVRLRVLKKKLVVVTSKKKGQGIRHGLTPSRILELCHAPVSEIKKAAALFRLSPTHVRNLKYAVAQTMRYRQKKFLANEQFVDWVSCRIPSSKCRCVQSFHRIVYHIQLFSHTH